MSTLPTRLGVPRSLLLRKTMPVPFGASFTACASEEVKAGRAAASSSSTRRGRCRLAASFQAAMCEAQQPRSPGDILMVTDLYQKKSVASLAVLHFNEMSLAAGGAAAPSTAGKRRAGSQGACLARLLCTLSHRSGRLSKLMTTASTPRRGAGAFLGGFATTLAAFRFCDTGAFLATVLIAFLLATVRFTGVLADGICAERRGVGGSGGTAL
eukprot:CAMPEP_0175408760 /NCGR_PEP_ID=MMETSP0095-20121207/40755_1 /TAXON_ID=311494 /ORGANISM="Alexandrium monilatum, Strain CCMP3105" /LENGTH=211 /DNA_ID=CAMNT_0016707681 /DNA_START=285 /DNA_END=917 /DNA_ORIENTATION=-